MFLLGRIPATSKLPPDESTPRASVDHFNGRRLARLKQLKPQFRSSFVTFVVIFFFLVEMHIISTFAGIKLLLSTSTEALNWLLSIWSSDFQRLDELSLTWVDYIRIKVMIVIVIIYPYTAGLCCVEMYPKFDLYKPLHKILFTLWENDWVWAKVTLTKCCKNDYQLFPIWAKCPPASPACVSFNFPLH